MRILVVISILFLTSNVLGQDTLHLLISCVDSETKNPIHHAELELTYENNFLKATSNEDGQATFKFILTDKKFNLSGKHGFYEDAFHLLNKRDLRLREGIATYTLKMDRNKTLNLGEVTASAPGVSIPIFQSKTLSVSDFEFLPNGELLLLLYPKSLKKGSSLGVLSGGEITSSFELNENPIELIHDFRGNAHVVCENGVYGVHPEQGEIAIRNHDRTYFMKYIFPIVDTNYSRYYFSNFNKNYPAFDYLIFDQLDSTYQQIIEIKDELMMELYRSEYKWVDIRTKLWAKNQELQTGIDKEIWVGSHYFTQSIYYKELYAPMFHQNDSIFVFDYYKDKLFTFDLSGKVVDSVPIFHHYQAKKTGWKKKVIQDRNTGEIYAFYEKGGLCSLRRVDLKTGLLGGPIVLQHKYVDEIAVHAGQAYYIYRPFESAQKKFLYQTKLPNLETE